MLIGHSQGSYHLQRLVRRRIDTHAALRRRMVSAVLLGGNVTVRKGSDRGGVFRRIRTCRKATQLSCVIAFSTFNETPPADALFGRGESRVASFLGLPKGAKLDTVCTNPAALGSDRSVAVERDRPGRAVRPGDADRRRDRRAGDPVADRATTFVQSDGSFTGRCSRAGGAHVLRIASTPGTPVPRASPTPDWGLHLLDANIAQGDLVKVLRRQIGVFANR